jgi:hypothetical protein
MGSHHRFKIGDIVKVKPGGEIHKTLDPSGKLDGCCMKGCGITNGIDY